MDGTVVIGYFFDTFLPFGLRSSPAVFIKFVNGLKFVLSSKVVSPIWSYLHDFWTCGQPSSTPDCKNLLDVILRMCDELGLKTNPKKQFN